MPGQIFVACLCMLLAGCGYRYGESSLATAYPTISVPFVIGDPDGDLTAAIVREITSSLPFRYCQNGGALILMVKIVDWDDENIGYRYTYKREGKRTNAIEPVETRMRMVVELSLVDATTGNPIQAPVRLLTTIDLDHDYNYSVWRRGVTQFSLGQLSDADAAFDAVRAPLNRAVAEKIAMYINSL